MSVFPTLSNGAISMYPVESGGRWATEVVQFCNDSEQRWPTRPGLSEFVLALTNLTGYDVSAVTVFFNSAKGAFDTTWSITVNGTTYAACVFDSDALEWSETRPGRYTAKLKIRQTAASVTAYVVPTNPVYFPQLNTLGMMVQHPYAVTKVFDTTKVVMPSGKQWGRARRGAGRANAPTGPLLRASLVYPSLTDTELGVLNTFFTAQLARYGEFIFLDPMGNLVPNSEVYSDASWTPVNVTVGAAATDPFGGTRATTITPAGTGSLTATVLPGGYASGFILCASAWVRPHSTAAVTISFVDSGGTTLATQSTTVPANTWRLIECPVTLATNNVVKVRVSSATVMELFGVQVAPQLGPGGYQRTPGNYGYHAKCRFDTDTFDATAVGWNQNSLKLSIAEYF